MTWTEVYRINFIDVFTAQGAVDLNGVGNPLIIDGVTWTSNPNAIQGALTSFALGPAGLEAVDVGFGVYTDAVQSSPHLQVPLIDLTPAGSVFAFSPAMEYRFEAYVAEQTATVNLQYAGISMYTPPPNGPPSPARTPTADDRNIAIGKGFTGTLSDALRFSQYPPTTPEQVAYGGANLTPLEVVSLHYINPQNIGADAGPFTGGDFGPDRDYQPVVGWRGAATDEDEYYGDPDFSRISLFFSSTSATTFNGTIEQFRILQK